MGTRTSLNQLSWRKRIGVCATSVLGGVSGGHLAESRHSHRGAVSGQAPRRRRDVPAGDRLTPSLGSSSPSSSSVGGSGAPSDQQALLRRGRRHLQGVGFNSFDFRGSRPTTETEFIAWGPTGEEEALESNTFPGIYGPTTVSIFQTRKTTVATATTTATATTATSMTLQTQGVTEPLDPRSRILVGVSTTETSTSPSKDSDKDSKPPRVLGETSGLAVHQIITITVSLIMVIAALITTLVLKNW
nr:adherens junction-associated protein 1 [Vicugna pacos]